MEKKDIFQDIQNIRSSNPVIVDDKIYWTIEGLMEI